MIRLAVYLQLDNGFDGILDWIFKLRKELAIEHSLAEMGIDEKNVIRIATMATEDPSAQSNPILCDAQQYKAILMAAIHGDCSFYLAKTGVGFAET